MPDPEAAPEGELAARLGAYIELLYRRWQALARAVELAQRIDRETEHGHIQMASREHVLRVEGKRMALWQVREELLALVPAPTREETPDGDST